MAKESENIRSALILYGSETGNAQEVAEELGRTAERLHFVTHVKECNDVKAASVVFQSRLGMIVLNKGLEYFSYSFTSYLCRLNDWPRRISTECPWILENAFVEKAFRDFS